MDELTKINAPPATVLVGTLAIDRDHEHVDRVHAGMQGLSQHCSWRLLVVTREQDAIVAAKWSRHGAEVVTVPDYEIRKRHNLWKIAEKRNLVRERARSEAWDALLFVDSDIVMSAGAIGDMFCCAQYADIVVAPYRIRWSNEFTVGVLDDGKLALRDARPLMEGARYPRILGGGLGCTLIQARALAVEIVPVQVASVPGLAGEDIGYFHRVHATRPDLVVRATSWPFVVEHLI
jgi:hypothetical protein